MTISDSSEALRSLIGLGLGSIFDDVRDGLMVVRMPEGSIVMVNRSAGEMCGLQRDLGLPIPVTQVFPDSAVLETAHSCSQMAEHSVGFWAGHPQAVLPTRIHSLKGYDVDVVLNFCRIEDPRSDDRLVLLVVRGDTQARVDVAVAAQAGAQERVEVLEDRARQQALFFNEAAHEFSTPLTILALQVHLLRAALKPVSSKQDAALQMMRASVRRLVLLSQDLADLAKANAGRLILKSTPVDVAAMTADEMAGFAQLATENKLSLDPTPKGAPVMVMGDPARLRQILANFIVNAIKFSLPGGRITLNITKTEGQVTINVTDRGRGMSAEGQALLFKPFGRVNEPGQTKVPGTGLGLYLSKRIAEAHGGQIGCSSPGINEGMTFWLKLPTITGVPGA